LSLVGNNQSGAGYGLLLTGALFSATAWSGNSKVDACRQAFQSYEVAMNAAAHESPPALAAAPPPTETAPGLATRPPPKLPPVAAVPQAAPSLGMRPREDVAKTDAPAPPATAKPPEAAPVKAVLPVDDAFHVAVGAPPARPATKPKANPQPPASDDVWRHFWREVP
jgi:hypothetical protein